MFKIRQLKIAGKRFSCKISCPEEIRNLIPETEFWAEYDFPLSEVPKSILLIPIATILWQAAIVLDRTLELEIADSNFVEGLLKMREGYQQIYSDVAFKGQLSVKTYEDISNGLAENTEVKSAMLFSGGVDAMATYVDHAKEQPSLLCILGSVDVPLDDQSGQKQVVEDLQHFSAEYNGCYGIIKSNFLEIISPQIVSGFPQLAGGWWHDIQHGPALLSLCAPYCWYHQINRLYIASSHTADNNPPLGSDPRIDNQLRWGDCQCHHSLFRLNRQEKIKLITDWHLQNQKPLKLRVCWEGKGGVNDCRCEKCCRTITGLLVAHQDPKDYGFSDVSLAYIHNSLKHKKWIFTTARRDMWQDIQSAIDEQSYDEATEFISFIRSFDFEKYSRVTQRRARQVQQLKSLLRKAKKKVKQLLKHN